MEGDKIHGLVPSYIENKEKYQSLIDEMRCPMCLEVVLNPVECRICNTLLCENCYIILKIANKKCAIETCEGKYNKANKYVRELLRTLKVKCEYCETSGMNYENYLEHLKNCTKYLEKPLSTIIVKIDQKVKEIESLKVQRALNKNTTQPTITKLQVTNKISISQKMELYNATVSGNFYNFKACIEQKNYPILEEISAKGVAWTPIHYALHYGKIQIAEYILNYFNNKGQINEIAALKSSDGRNPLLCILKSNMLDNKGKRDIFLYICNKYKIPIDEDTRLELVGRRWDDILISLKY